MTKIVLFGYSKSGREIAKLLKSDEYELIVLDDNPLHVGDANRDGHFAKYSTFNDDSILEEVGIGNDVEVLFCASHDESLNLFVTLSARNMDANLKILTLIYRKEDEKKMLLAGANRTISPYEVGAVKAFRIIEKPKVSRVLNLFSLQSQKLSISEIKIPKGSPLDGIYFKNVTLFAEFNTIFLGIVDKELADEFIFFSKGINHKIDADDIVVVLGSQTDIKKLKTQIGII